MRALVAAAVFFGCSATPTPAGEPAGPPPIDAAPGVAPFPFPDGTFAVKSNRKIIDNCKNMVWGSESVVIDRDARTLYSVPDDRLYAVRFDGGALVARGTFTDGPGNGCPNDTYVELWRLEHQGEDRLTGYVTTYSHFQAHDCLQACKAVFSVELERPSESEPEN